MRLLGVGIVGDCGEHVAMTWFQPRAGALAAALLSCSAAAATVQPFAALYEGRKAFALFTATAQARLELQRAGDTLRYTMDTTVKWTLIERRIRDCSLLRIDGDRLVPLEYRHIDDGDAKLDVHTRFDWTQQQATTQLGDGTAPRVVPVAGPTWDPLSLQLALMAAAPRRAPATVETYRAVERGRLKEHRVEFAGPTGTNRGLYRVTSRKPDGDEAVLLLLAAQGFQPQQVTIDGVTIERVGGAASSAAPKPPLACPSRGAPR